MNRNYKIAKAKMTVVHCAKCGKPATKDFSGAVRVKFLCSCGHLNSFTLDKYKTGSGKPDPMANKVAIDGNNQAVFTCPQCGKSKAMDASPHMGKGAIVRIKCTCPCGHTASFALERRKYNRKRVQLSGMILFGDGSSPKEVTVVNISQKGLKVKHNANFPIRLGRKFFVGFNMDDADNTFVRREVVVKKVYNNSFGAEFVSDDR